MGLRYARGDCADTDFRHQFYGHGCVRIAVLEVEDQLRQVFD